MSVLRDPNDVGVPVARTLSDVQVAILLDDQRGAIEHAYGAPLRLILAAIPYGWRVAGWGVSAGKVFLTRGHKDLLVATTDWCERLWVEKDPYSLRWKNEEDAERRAVDHTILQLQQRVEQLEGKNQELMSALIAARVRNVELETQYNTLNAYMNKLHTQIQAARKALES